MGFFDGITSIVSSPIKLIEKTIDSTMAIPKEAEDSPGKAIAKIAIPGSTVIEGAKDTVEHIKEEFNNDK